MEGAGHYPHVEMADQVAPRIISFLGSLSPAPAAAGITRLHRSDEWRKSASAADATSAPRASFRRCEASPGSIRAFCNQKRRPTRGPKVWS